VIQLLLGEILNGNFPSLNHAFKIILILFACFKSSCLYEVRFPFIKIPLKYQGICLTESNCSVVFSSCRVMT